MHVILVLLRLNHIFFLQPFVAQSVKTEECVTDQGTVTVAQDMTDTGVMGVSIPNTSSPRLQILEILYQSELLYFCI